MYTNCGASCSEHCKNGGRPAEPPHAALIIIPFAFVRFIDTFSTRPTTHTEHSSAAVCMLVVRNFNILIEMRIFMVANTAAYMYIYGCRSAVT